MSIDNITPLTNSVIEQIPNYYRRRRQILFIFNERDVLIIHGGWKMIAGYRYLYTRREETNTTVEQTNNNSMTRDETVKLINEIVDKKIQENNEVNNKYLLSEVDKKIKENNEVNNKYLLSEMDKKDAALLVSVRNIIREEVRAVVKEEVRAVVKEEVRAVVKEEVRTVVKEEVRAVVKAEVRIIVKEEIDPINKRLDNLVKKNNLKE